MTGKRLNIVLDKDSFEKLKRTKERHNDNYYTQTIKRAIALLYFIVEKREEGMELFLADKKTNKLKELVFM